MGRLEALCHMVKNTSLCGLGQTAPNPTLSTLRYFRQEYEKRLRTEEPGRRGLPLVTPGVAGVKSEGRAN
jgi:bidirectional [NiFe] hydrogenase diaphorase subunit